MGRRTLFLDAMGTLLTLRAPAAQLRSALRDRLGVEVTQAQARAALAAEIAHYRAHLGTARDPDSLRELRTRCADVLFQALPRRPALAAADGETRTEVLLAALEFAAFPDARRLLERARAAGVPAFVVSNWDVSLPEALERAALAPLLDGVVVSAVVGAAKPSPAIFARALELAGTAARDCLHVGDSLAEDVAGARGAGIEAVLLDRGGAAAQAEGVSVIASLDELSPLRWSAG
jgi:HAD superfamily hydrolase (TIGR01549 family)